MSLSSMLTFLVAIGAAVVASFSVRLRFFSSDTIAEVVVVVEEDATDTSLFVSCLLAVATFGSIFDLITNLNAGFC